MTTACVQIVQLVVICEVLPMTRCNVYLGWNCLGDIKGDIGTYSVENCQGIEKKNSCCVNVYKGEYYDYKCCL